MLLYILKTLLSWCVHVANWSLLCLWFNKSVHSCWLECQTRASTLAMSSNEWAGSSAGLWAKQSIPLSFTLSLTERAKPRRKHEIPRTPIILPSLFMIPSSFLPACPDGFPLCFPGWMMPTPFEMLMTSQTFLLSPHKEKPWSLTSVELCWD